LLHHGPSPTGPWKCRGALLISDRTFKGPGHHAFVQDPGSGEWLIVYHRWEGKAGDGPYTDDRRIAIQPITYDALGHIVFYSGERAFVLSERSVRKRRNATLPTSAPIQHVAVSSSAGIAQRCEVNPSAPARNTIVIDGIDPPSRFRRDRAQNALAEHSVHLGGAVEQHRCRHVSACAVATQHENAKVAIVIREAVAICVDRYGSVAMSSAFLTHLTGLGQAAQSNRR
jgi:hypothetical protein